MRAVAIVVGLISLGLLPGCGDTEPAATVTQTVTVAADPVTVTTLLATPKAPPPPPPVAATSERSTPPPPPESTTDDLDLALSGLDTVRARVDQVSDSNILIEARTPAGGFQGASTKDLNRAAGAIFTAIYGSTTYRRPVAIIFRGGLVSTTTGKDLPDQKTGQYRMTRSDAKAINWSNDDEVALIEWKNFREFVHPAIKQDD